MSPKPLLPKPALMLVTSLEMCGGEEALVNIVTKAVKGGVNMVQLREKQLQGSELLHLGRVLKRVTGSRALLLINDRVDVALGCSADGVEMPERALPVAVVSSIAPNLIVGCSVHSTLGVAQAELMGADFALLGTIFETSSKAGSPASGTGIIKESLELAKVPIIGIGGINAGNAAEVMRAGADGVAVQSAILKASDPEKAARELKAVLEKAVKERETHSHPSISS